MLAEAFVKQSRSDNAVFFGGFASAQRRMLGFFPEPTAPEESVFPLQHLEFPYLLPGGQALSHRDVLGSLMHLGLTRDSVGDILLQPDICRFVVLGSVAQTVLDDLTRVGRAGVRCRPASPADFVFEQSFLQGRGTVSSLRLDCVVALFCAIPRQKSAVLIQSGMVQCNAQEQSSVSKILAPGDVLSVRGYGKFCLDTVGSATRKNRFPVEYRKYN
jgi:Uncharacterized conserved protein, contains S4-like domain